MTFAPQERGRAFGVYGAVVGIAASLGQALGGLLIRADVFGLSWRPVFLVNLPIGVAVLVAAARYLPESRSATAPRLDLGGVGSLSVGLSLLAYPLVEGRDAGWPAWAWLCLAASLPVLVAFVRFERRVTARGGAPLVVLRLFRERAFVAGLLVALPNNATASASFFILALYLQLGLHYSALAAGLIFAPGALGFVVAATFSVRFIPRLGSRLIAIGLAILIVSYAISATIVRLDGESPPAFLLALAIVIQGLGAGSSTPPLFGAILAGIDRDDAGAASGGLSTAQQIGSALGVAIIGVVLFGAFAAHAPRVSGDLAPALDRQLAPALGDAGRATTVADFRACADDRARSHDPAIAPASCQRPSLHGPDPAVAAAVAAFLQRANARNYADAYVVSVLASMVFLIIALASAFRLPTPRRPRRE